jgi:hypothetical protein
MKKLHEVISGEMKEQASITMDELFQTIQSVLVNELHDPTFIREFSGYAKTCGITQMYKLYETEDGEDRFISIDIGGCMRDGYKNFLRLYTDYDNDGSRWVTIYLHLTCLNSFKDKKAADILHINNAMNDIAIISSSLSKFGLHDGVYEQFILKLYHAIRNKMQQKYDENYHKFVDESKNTLPYGVRETKIYDIDQDAFILGDVYLIITDDMAEPVCAIPYEISESVVKFAFYNPYVTDDDITHCGCEVHPCDLQNGSVKIIDHITAYQGDPRVNKKQITRIEGGYE